MRCSSALTRWAFSWKAIEAEILGRALASPTPSAPPRRRDERIPTCLVAAGLRRQSCHSVLAPPSTSVSQPGSARGLANRQLASQGFPYPCDARGSDRATPRASKSRWATFLQRRWLPSGRELIPGAQWDRGYTRPARLEHRNVFGGGADRSVLLVLHRTERRSPCKPRSVF